jgi:hypothetical protein
MMGYADVPGAVKNCLRNFFTSLGRDVPEFEENTDLIEGTGACSDEGVDFAIDLQEALGVEVPNDFNPFVHESGRRGMRYRELVRHAERFVAASKEVAHAKR